jgi:transketolase
MEQLPRQFINAGVAEQNMTGMAAGMALSGKIAFTYSIANFPTMRCLEQVRNDVCYHNANVKVVSVGGGFTYGAMGATHHAIEDLAVMRALPGLVVVAPGDPVEARRGARDGLPRGPCYLRLGKAGEPIVHTSAIDFELGKAICMREGADATLISTGGILQNTVRAAERLAAEGIQTRVLSMHTLKPLDVDAVLTAARETEAIFTIEEHSVLGGLGTAVAEVLAEAEGLKRLTLSLLRLSTTSSQDMLQCHGLTPEAIAKTVSTPAIAQAAAR